MIQPNVILRLSWEQRAPLKYQIEHQQWASLDRISYLGNPSQGSRPYQVSIWYFIHLFPALESHVNCQICQLNTIDIHRLESHRFVSISDFRNISSSPFQSFADFPYFLTAFATFCHSKRDIFMGGSSVHGCQVAPGLCRQLCCEAASEDVRGPGRSGARWFQGRGIPGFKEEWSLMGGCWNYIHYNH